MVTDTRPMHTPMPEEAAAIWQQLVDRLKPMLDEAYARVEALPGVPARQQNDALSGLATVGAFIAQQLTARVMMAKRVDLNDAFPIVMAEIHQRAAAELLVIADRAGRVH